MSPAKLEIVLNVDAIVLGKVACVPYLFRIMDGITADSNVVFTTKW